MSHIKTFILVMLFLCSIGMAATHYVSPSGSATWANSTNIATPCSLATANTNAAAGDLVYLRAGTYTTAIEPANSGTGTPPSGPWSFIIYRAYTGETPVIAPSSGNNIDLTGKSYIQIDGVTTTYAGGYTAIISSGAAYNEIKNSTFNAPDGGPLTFNITSLETTAGGPWATHNWIHNNVFSTSGQANGDGGKGCTDGGGDTMGIGHAYSASFAYSSDNSNTVEDNVFRHTPHAQIDSYGMYTVIRNNVFHNEPWSAGCPPGGQYPSTYSSSNPDYSAYEGKYSHRNFAITEDYGRTATYQLVEGNRAGYAGANQANGGADNLDIAAPQNIVRYNSFYAAMNAGIRFKYHWGGGNGGGGNGGSYNRVYNNTVYQNGYGYPYASYYPSPCSSASCPWGQSAIETENSDGNIVKNNLFYLSASYTIRGWDVDSAGAPSNGWGTIVPSNNWCSGTQSGGDNGGCSASGNPQFTNPSLTDPTSLVLPDLTLQSGSGAINTAAALTTATNSGSGSTTLTVADALYFQDGTWGSNLAKSSAGLGGTMQADWIAIGTVTNTAQISSITYGTYNSPAGTITLASPKTWSNGASIWLYKKSDGVVVLTSTAPDYGAYEYASGSFSKCDINMDGSVNSTDVELLADVILGTQASTQGDINGDSAKNILDLMIDVGVVYNGATCPP
jgi:hypothetical protein